MSLRRIHTIQKKFNTPIQRFRSRWWILPNICHVFAALQVMQKIFLRSQYWNNILTTTARSPFPLLRFNRRRDFWWGLKWKLQCLLCIHRNPNSLVDVDGCSKRISAYGLTVQENKDSTKLFKTKLNNMGSYLLSGDLERTTGWYLRHWKMGHRCQVSINCCQDTPILGKFQNLNLQTIWFNASMQSFTYSNKRLSVLVNILLIKCNNNYFNWKYSSNNNC